ncbi:MAG: beta-lactamase family protein [Alphaproteobacteria bacterium]|nr:beta-lactamase family protein [Alphaproteobacteria bacterium]
MMKFSAAIVIAAVLLVSPAVANPQSEGLASIDPAVRDAVQKQGFGGYVLVEVRGKPVFSKGYGDADREKKLPFRVDTIAQIGSLTKSMTAFAILNLVREGKIDLEKPVKAYLPGAAEPAASTTIHQLLTHHAGLTDHCGEDFDPLTKEAELHTCMAKPLEFKPGEDHYSNMGYSILAAVVEQVSGQSWEDYERVHLWQPLGMKDTGFAQFAGTKPERFAYGYPPGKPRDDVVSNSIIKLHGADWNLRGNGGTQSTVVDMERYYRALSGKIPGIPRDVAAQMTSPRDPIEGEAWEGYGFAVRLDKNKKPYRIGFAGSDEVFMSYFGWLPRQDVFIYVVGNNGWDNVKPVISTVLHAAYKIAGITPDMLQPKKE